MTENNIDNAVDLIRSSNKILVFTGAGISTNCGIPDFRGEKGLYETVKKRFNLPYPEAVFDIEYFRKNPAPFYELSKEFFTEEVHPSLSHKFISWLEEQGRVNLVMTQNIDMLHSKAGSKNVIECHGTYEIYHCIKCGISSPQSNVEQSVKKGEVPYCVCGGVIKPDVVFFGEQLPDKFYRAYNDPPDADLILVMGTSLAVQPAAGFALMYVKKIKSILINIDRTAYDGWFTRVFNMDLDEFSMAVWDKMK